MNNPNAIQQKSKGSYSSAPNLKDLNFYFTQNYSKVNNHPELTSTTSIEVNSAVQANNFSNDFDGGTSTPIDTIPPVVSYSYQNNSIQFLSNESGDVVIRNDMGIILLYENIEKNTPFTFEIPRTLLSKYVTVGVTDMSGNVTNFQVPVIIDYSVATNIITEIEGPDFIVTEDELQDQTLDLKGRLLGLYVDDTFLRIIVKVILPSQTQLLEVEVTQIDENGYWTVQVPLNGLNIVDGEGTVYAEAEIQSIYGDIYSSIAEPTNFILTLDRTEPVEFAQSDSNQINFEQVNVQNSLETVNSTQFINLLNISDRLKGELENGSALEIGSFTSQQRNLFNPSETTIKSDTTGKITLSFQDLSLLTVAKAYGIVLQKLDDNGVWQYHMSAPLFQNGVVATLGTQYALGAVDNDGERTLTFNGLTEGQYRVSSYIIPSELTQFLKDFELSNLGAEGTLLGQKNQDFLIDLVSKTLGEDSPSTQQLISFIQTLLVGVNTVTLPISFILDRITDLPLLRHILFALDKFVDYMVAPVVTNTIDLLHNLNVNISYTESYIQSKVITGNVLTNDYSDINDLNLIAVKVFDGNVYQSYDIQAGSLTEVVGQFGTLRIGSNGEYSYSAFANSHEIKGNEYFKYSVILNGEQKDIDLIIKINGNDALNLTAVDDENYLQLAVDPTVIQQNLQQVTAGGLAYVGLGSVLDLNAIRIENVLQFNIEHDTSRVVTLKAESGGVQVLTDFDLFIYKWNAEFQQYELYKQHQDWFGVALLGGVSDEITYTLESGQYIALIEPTRGINALYGYTLKTTQDLLLDYANPLAVYGKASGNVIDDINQTQGSKDYSPNLEALYITAVNGQNILGDQNHSGLKIEGQYGELEIFATGDYTYTAYNNKTFNYGETEIFTYTVYDPILNQWQNAELKITLDLVDYTPQMDLVKVDLVIDPSETYYKDLSVKNSVTQGKKSTTGFGVVDIGLGNVLSADIISSKPGLNIQVKQGELASIQFSATGTSVVGVGNVSDLMIYKKNLLTGKYELYHSSDSFLIVPLAVLGIPLGGIYNTPEKVVFSEGEYIAYLVTQGVSVIGGTTLSADNMTVYDYNHVDDYQGYLEGDLGLADHLKLSAIEDQNLNDTEITLVGDFGTLTISETGQYHYQVNPNLPAPPYGNVDTFSYVVTDTLTGQSTVSVLNVKLSSVDAQSDRVDENGQQLTTYATLTNKLNESDVVFNASSALSKSNKVQATALDKFSKKINFDIDVNQTSKGLKLKFEGLADVSSSKIDLTYSLVLVKNHLGQTVNQVIATDSISQVAQASLNLELHNLAGGKYELVLNMPGKAGSFRYFGYDFKVYNQYADQWVHDPDAQDPGVTGNLIANDSFNDALLSHTILKINGKTILLDPSKTAQDIAVTGQYGVLHIQSDGQYQYVANGQGGGKEIFVYELISPTGDSDKATLEIDVAKNVIGSNTEDRVESGSADDIYFLGNGADTVIFNLLDTLDARGGNGTDTWKDFDHQDKIDISALLDGATSTNIEQYVSVSTVNGDTQVFVDRDGQGATPNTSSQSQFELTHLITLQDRELSLDQLLQNNQIIY